jgi:hypothetical protein
MEEGPRHSTSKQGYLFNGKKKLYYILTDDKLSWYNAPLVILLHKSILYNQLLKKGTIKGMIELRDYDILLKDNKIELHPLANAEVWRTRTFKRQTKVKSRMFSSLENDANEINDWFEKMQLAKTLSFSNRSSSNHQGWLEKKGQTRWFILKDGVLYWFHKEQVIFEISYVKVFNAFSSNC